MQKAIIKKVIIVTAVIVSSSFTVNGDTSKPRKGFWSWWEKAISVRRERRARNDVSLKLMEIRLNKNDSTISKLIQEKEDSVTKNE